MPTPRDIRSGLVAATAAYGLWGFLPLFFHALAGVDPLTILAHRILWSAPTALALILLAGKWGEFAGLWRNPKLVMTLLLSSIAIAVNWTIYIWAVANGHVLEGSLGYFINPLVVFVLAALFFGERFNPLQIIAVGLATAGVVNQTINVGVFPLVSLSLAMSFAIYGAVRKTTAVDSRVGFAAEAMLLAPLALGYLLAFLPAGEAAFGRTDLAHVLLVLAGPITAAPLILFAVGARRLRLSTIGLLQFLAPSIQFGIGLWLGEPFTPAQAITFGLIWSGVILFTLAGRRPRPAVPAASAT